MMPEERVCGGGYRGSNDIVDSITKIDGCELVHEREVETIDDLRKFRWRNNESVVSETQKVRSIDSFSTRTIRSEARTT